MKPRLRARTAAVLLTLPLALTACSGGDVDAEPPDVDSGSVDVDAPDTDVPDVDVDADVEQDKDADGEAGDGG